MAKKFGKFLLFTAAVSGAAAAAYHFFQKKDADDLAFEDEDYDDFSEDLDDDTEADTKYVSLTPDAEASDGEESGKKKNSFVPLNQVAQPVDKTDDDKSDKAAPDVEEFFDEEDGADEEPPIEDN